MKLEHFKMRMNHILRTLPKNITWYSIHEMAKCELYRMAIELQFVPLPEYKIAHPDGSNIYLDMVWFLENNIIEAFQIECEWKKRAKKVHQKLRDIDINVNYIIIKDIEKLIEVDIQSTLEQDPSPQSLPYENFHIPHLQNERTAILVEILRNLKLKDGASIEQWKECALEMGYPPDFDFEEDIEYLKRKGRIFECSEETYKLA